MKVLVTGATGFTGSFVVPRLCKHGHQVRCFVRETSNSRSLEELSSAECVRGDLDDSGSLQRALKGVDGLINIASLGFGHAPGIVSAAKSSSLQRALFVSTTAVFTQLNAASKAVRLAAENLVVQSGLPFTIIRPTMIYGTARDRNMCRLVRFLMRSPVMPVLGDGKSLQQPIYVEDLATAIVDAFEAGTAVGKSYNVAGAAALTFNEVIDTVARLLGRKIRKLHFPAGLAYQCLRSFEKLRLRLPIKSEQVLRLNENKAFDFTDAARDFGYAPRSFAAGIEREIQEILAERA